MHETKTLHAPSVDILLILEGTYPYVSGGVATWVHQLIQLFPKYTFGAVFLGGLPQDYKGMQYTLPKNLTHLEAHYLFELKAEDTTPKPPASREAFSEILCTHKQLKSSEPVDFKALAHQLNAHYEKTDHVGLNDFLHGRQAFDFVTEQYDAGCPQASFLDYFWSIRNMHIPITKLLNLVGKTPKAKVIHSISTGYAGFLGAMLSEHDKTPYILTEHGIYIKERKIDLLQHQWVAANYFKDIRDEKSKEYLMRLWISFFETIGKFCYAAANPIISLFPAYQAQQIHYGALPERTRIVPNCINLASMPMTKKRTPDTEAPIIAFIGRVVPIKDVKNFIRAMVVVFQTIPNATAWIVGSTDEDPGYYKECQDLVNVLSLKEKVQFKGRQKTSEILQQIDLCVLSSISEGLPLVVLESFASGVPMVCTDVGACRELICGATPDDQALGQAGVIVNIADSNALAAGMLALLTDPALWQSSQSIGHLRVKTFYNEPDFLTSYESIYEKAMTSWQG